jgi:hypothetical protein
MMVLRTSMTASSPELPDGPVTNAANSLLQAGILGSLVLLMGMALAYVVLKWNKASELRVKDQKEAMEAVRKSSEAYTALVTGTTGALRDMVSMTDALKDAVKANTEASRTMERTINETLREAIRAATTASGYRRFTPPSGTGGTGGTSSSGSSSPSGSGLQPPPSKGG